MGYLRFVIENARWLLVGFLLSFTSSYGQTFFISIFAGDIRAEFGLSHGEWGAIYSFGTMASALVMVWAGMVTDYFRVRTLAPVVLVALSAACLFMASVPSAFVLGFVIFTLRFTGQGMTGQIGAVAMARWFVATRGRAMSIASLGFATGQALMPIVFVALLAHFVWRDLWVLAAGLAVIMIGPLLWLLREERTPQSMAQATSSLGMEGRHWTRIEMLRHPLFWLMVPLFMGPPSWGTALFFQQVHFVEVKGWDLSAYVALYPLLTLASVSTTFAAGIAVDRFGAGRVLPLSPLGIMLGLLLLSHTGSLGIAAFALCIVGFGLGMQMAMGAFWAEYYGTRYIGGIKAVSMGVMVLASAIGPGVSGWLIDQGINFSEQMKGYAVYFLVSSLLAVFGIRKARATLPLAA